jgi:hypothetical protein
VRRLLAFLDPLLGCAPLVIKPDYRQARKAQIRDDEADSREQLPEVELHPRHYSPCGLPTGRLVEKALVPDHWFMTGAAHRTLQQFRNVPLQTLVGLSLESMSSTTRSELSKHPAWPSVSRSNAISPIQNQASIGSHSRSLEIDLQGSIERELKALMLFLTHRVRTP